MFLAMQDKMIERLRAKLPPEVNVSSLADLVEVEEQRNRWPAVFAIYEGYVPGDRKADTIAQIELRWTVVVCCRTAVGNGAASEARRLLDDLSHKTIKALLGYSVAPGARLRVAAAPAPQYQGGGAYLPLGFTCAASFHADG